MSESKEEKLISRESEEKLIIRESEEKLISRESLETLFRNVQCGKLESDKLIEEFKFIQKKIDDKQLNLRLSQVLKLNIISQLSVKVVRNWNMIKDIFCSFIHSNELYLTDCYIATYHNEDDSIFIQNIIETLLSAISIFAGNHIYDHIFRDECVPIFGWSIPNMKALNMIKKIADGKSILETCAGVGLWSSLLRLIGVHIIPTDNTIKGNIIEILNYNSKDAALQFAFDILFMSWPPYDNIQDLEVYQARNFEIIIIVGEDDYGCTGSGQGREYLSDRYTLLHKIDIPNWNTIHDFVQIYVKIQSPEIDRVNAVIEAFDIIEDEEDEEDEVNTSIVSMKYINTDQFEELISELELQKMQLDGLRDVEDVVNIWNHAKSIFCRFIINVNLYSTNCIAAYIDEDDTNLVKKTIEILLSMSDRFIEIFGAQSFRFRINYIEIFGYSIPNMKALNIIKKIAGTSPILETCAGVGFWSALLRLIGVNIISTDDNIDNNSFVEILKSDSVDAVEKVNLIMEDTKLKILFTSWPPYNNEQDFWVYSTGNFDILLLINEGAGGCTGSNKGYNYLRDNYDELHDIEIPNWYSYHDSLHIYTKKGVESDIVELVNAAIEN